MPVTEFAIISLRCAYDELDFIETLMECQELQDSWVRENHPYNLEPNMNLSSMYVERSEPPSLLITAPWDSPDAHGEWIQTGQNQRCNAKLSEFIRPGCDAVQLMHLSPAGRDKQLRRAFLEKESFNVCRVWVSPDNKDNLQKAYDTVEESTASEQPDQRIWAGWKTEDGDHHEELVVFWTDDVSWDRLKILKEMADKTERRRFTHVA